jgi:hypothetical protein
MKYLVQGLMRTLLNLLIRNSMTIIKTVTAKLDISIVIPQRRASGGFVLWMRRARLASAVCLQTGARTTAMRTTPRASRRALRLDDIKKMNIERGF